jgi:hypothetical protein
MVMQSMVFSGSFDHVPDGDDEPEPTDESSSGARGTEGGKIPVRTSFSEM